MVPGINEDDASESQIALHDVNNDESEQNGMGANIYFEFVFPTRTQTLFYLFMINFVNILYFNYQNYQKYVNVRE